jgi:chitinase
MKFKSLQKIATRFVLLPLLLLFTLFQSCQKEDVPGGDDNGGGNDQPAALVEGRVALAYVTYYGTAIPDARYITHINYAFAELYVKDGVYQGFKLQGSQARFNTIVNLKNLYPHLKICLSFTHTVANSDNSQGGGFSALAKSDQYRKEFASDCKAFLENNHLDGIDIDWEFPGLSWSGHACDPAVDVDNFTLLMKQLRETLDSKYLLTYAGYVRNKRAVTGGYRFIDVAAVSPYVDYVNLMTYDISEAPKHQSALFNHNADWDCERTVNEYVNAGVPANKLVLGVPFYGRHSFSVSPGAYKYKTIKAFDPAVYKIDNWDDVACVPYVTKNGEYFCGYDNERSISLKSQWLLSRGMKGMMYWEYDQDDDVGTLRKAVWQSVMKK